MEWLTQLLCGTCVNNDSLVVEKLTAAELSCFAANCAGMAEASVCLRICVGSWTASRFAAPKKAHIASSLESQRLCGTVFCEQPRLASQLEIRCLSASSVVLIEPNFLGQDASIEIQSTEKARQLGNRDFETTWRDREHAWNFAM